MQEKDKKQWDIITKGGLRDKITLSGREMVIGELPIKNRGILFECMESDLAKLEVAKRDYLDQPSPGVFGAIAAILRAFTGRRKRAAGIVRHLMEDITKNDYRLVKACVVPFNGFWMRFKIRPLFWNATFSEIQEAIKKIFDINHIDIKNHLVTRGEPSPFNRSEVAKPTSTDGMQASSNTQDGQGKK